MGKICSIFGQREADRSPEKFEKLKALLEKWITIYKVDTFLFSDTNKFSYFCYEVLGEIKKDYPFIKRNFIFKEGAGSRKGDDKCLANMTFDNLIFRENSNSKNFSLEEILSNSNFVIIQDVDHCTIYNLEVVFTIIKLKLKCLAEFI